MHTVSLACPKERIEVLSTSVMTSYMGQLVVEPPDAAERARALDVRAGDAAGCKKQCESVRARRSYRTLFCLPLLTFSAGSELL